MRVDWHFVGVGLMGVVFVTMLLYGFYEDRECNQECSPNAGTVSVGECVCTP